MPLKSIELAGYKTFANKTTFEFSKRITAIVGPNGSGKSNIADAVRWVLGEQSYSLMRGRKTVDMIFSGSEHRPRAGMASATVVFDNESAWLPIDFSEVAITRRAYRDGQNDYLINGQKVRLRDVADLLGRSGLSEGTYTIIGQGLVDTALSLKAEERRQLFEDAAGIGIYRHRKEEAVRRMEAMRRNLDRARDILAELKPRLNSLERQSRRSRDYEQVKDDLKSLLLEWYGYHWYRAQREVLAAGEEYHLQEKKLTIARAIQSDLERVGQEVHGRIQELRQRLGGWRQRLGQLQAQRSQGERELGVSEARRMVVSGRQASADQEIGRIKAENRIALEELDRVILRFELHEDQARRFGGRLLEVSGALRDRQAERSRLEDQRRTIAARRAAIETNRIQDAARLKAQVEMLAQAELVLKGREDCASLLRDAAQGLMHEDADLAALEITDREFAEQAAALGERLTALPVEELQVQVNELRMESTLADRAHGELLSRKSELEERIARLQSRLEALAGQRLQDSGEQGALEKRQTALKEEQTLLDGQIRVQLEQLEPAERNLLASELEREGLLNREIESRKVLAAAERGASQAQNTSIRQKEQLEILQGRIEEDFGLVAYEYEAGVPGQSPLPLGEIVQSLPHIETLPDEYAELVKNQRLMLRRMGPVNPEAQREYQEVKERFEFLTGQITDLEKAEIDVQEVISELDVLMEREFRRTFDTVAQEFRQIFARLFGGGTARLVLTDPDNLTTTGVEIEARLPGRRAQGLSLLSGGERSLTATALVFALLKTSPTPFCLLDEVDAMLDEANTYRFSDLLTELSERTQFIVITHNRNTVQVADVIYGITMGRDSASQVLSLKLDGKAAG